MFPIRDHNPSNGTPFVTWGLIAINVIVWLWSVAAFGDDQALGQFYYDYAMIPARISMGENWTALLTSMFLHAGILHLAGNMLFLFVFGDNLEDEMGHLGFLAFYLASGVAADLAQYAAAPWSPVPTVGASGAIAGVMGGYLLLFPRARVDVLIFLVVFFRILPVPAWIMLGLWFALQLVRASDRTRRGAASPTGRMPAASPSASCFALPVFLRLGGPAFWSRTHGHPPHPETRVSTSSVPVVRRRR